MSKTFQMNVGMIYQRPGTSEVINLNANGQYESGKAIYLKEAQFVLKHITISNVIPVCSILVVVSAQKKYTCSIRACSSTTPITPATVILENATPETSSGRVVLVYAPQK